MTHTVLSVCCLKFELHLCQFGSVGFAHSSQFFQRNAVVHDDFHAKVLDSLLENVEVLFREMRGRLMNF